MRSDIQGNPIKRGNDNRRISRVTERQTKNSRRRGKERKKVEKDDSYLS